MLQMERVNHVDIVQVGGSSFVSKVDVVLEGNVPDGECFKFGVAALMPRLYSWYSWDRQVAILPLPGPGA